ncbi:RHS repeat protein, partial [Hymenobacter sp. H14-R3]|uniref:RHS repeat domain-containing protein n=1 Tax=Hymenobacter sp. H14-R3 TaxID=3046308 RepID=UPI0024BBCEBC
MVEDSISGRTRHSYDAAGSLTATTYADQTQEVRSPDAVGNLFRSPTHSDQEYARGGQLRAANGARYKYDGEGNLIRKTTAQGQVWRYAWNGAGHLEAIRIGKNQLYFRGMATVQEFRISDTLWARLSPHLPVHVP